ncbi:MAG: M48 family metalloprotease [Candidatus Pacearchaeota archaeon]
MDDNLKSFFILAVISVIVFFIFDSISILFAFILIILIIFFFYFASDRIILDKYEAEPAINSYVKRTVKELSKKAGIKEPKIYMLNINLANALAVGKSRKNASIGITRKLLQLEKPELKAVIAYEIAYIKNNTVLLGCVMAMIAGLIVSISYFLKWFFDTLTTKKSKIGLIFFSIAMPIAALLLHITLSRKEKFKADLKASKLLEQPYSLISALKKLDKEKATGFEWSAHLFFVSPLTKFSSILFSTHPSLGERVRRLRKFWKKKETKRSAYQVTNI